MSREPKQLMKLRHCVTLLGTPYTHRRLTDLRYAFIRRRMIVHYPQLIMAADPFVLSIAADNPRLFGQPVYAIPDYDQSEMPRYTHQELLAFLAPEEDDAVMMEALKCVNNKTLGAEIHHYRCLCKGYEAAEAEVRRRIELRHRIAGERKKSTQHLQ